MIHAKEELKGALEPHSSCPVGQKSNCASSRFSKPIKPFVSNSISINVRCLLNRFRFDVDDMVTFGQEYILAWT